MPGCRLPSQTTATALPFSALYLQPPPYQEPDPCFAFSGGNNPQRIEGTGAMVLSFKKYPSNKKKLK
jgi:hypothetical protein